MLPENYQKMEWFGALELVLPTNLSVILIWLSLPFLGDGPVEAAAVDHAASVYNKVVWDPDHFAFIKERITMNHRLWKAGLRSHLEMYFFAEDFNHENLQRLLPHEPEGLQGSSFAVGEYFVKNKVRSS